MEKYSKQREEILLVIKESYEHLTAEEIYKLVKKKNSTASRGTVYRNLNFLTKKGDIVKLSMQVGPDRYDYYHKPHHHTICKQCGKVFDFEYKIDFTQILQNIYKQTEIYEIFPSMILEGICKNCKLPKKEEK